MKLSIATPEKIMFKGDVENVNISTYAGDIGVLSHHTALISVVKEGSIKIKTEEGEKVYKNKQGVIEIHNNEAIILVRGCTEE
ncbi:MAG: F0F1 ATP synthase subunit epsilon [Candidatus Paceibacterota bacterium]|jgi:F-type H+-transporting ATPase subunit epsilon|nr:F0F1 ATP synthase subunit epsilon [bacterium]